MPYISRTYNVAGHVFVLEMPVDHPIWSLLTNYHPFETLEESDEPMFSLHVNEGSKSFFCEEDAKLILVDKSDEDMPRIELYEQAERLLFRVSIYRESPICFEMMADKDFRRAEIVIHQEAGRFPVDNALMLLYAFRSAMRNTIEMHASVIKKEGMAYLFLGRSGTGKSTHSRQWLSAFADAILLNDDNPIVKIEGERVICYGSPWSGKTACYKNDSAPIAAIVLLRQAPENTMRRLSLPEAYAAIYSSTSGLRCDKHQADGLHQTIASLLNVVPCFQLDCLPDEAAAHLCWRTANGVTEMG